MGDVRVIVTTADELRAIVRDLLRNELAELRPEARPALLAREGLARELGVSVATITRERARGMPCVLVGESARYDLVEVLEWLRIRRQKGIGGSKDAADPLSEFLADDRDQPERDDA